MQFGFIQRLINTDEGRQLLHKRRALAKFIDHQTVKINVLFGWRPVLLDPGVPRAV